MTFNGTVKNFNPLKGFGFVVADDGLEIFLHVKGVADGGVPQAGDKVTFDLEESKMKPGQMQANNVKGCTGTADAKGGGAVSGVVGTGTLTGTCKSFNPEKGYGFITPADGSENVFFNAKQMVDGSSPQSGDSLTYDVGPSPIKPGQMQANNVTGGTGSGAKGGGGWDGGGKGKGNGIVIGWGGKASCGGKGDGWGGGKGDGWGGGKDGGWGKSKGDGWGKSGPYDGGKGKGKGWGGDAWGGDAWGW